MAEPKRLPVAVAVNSEELPGQLCYELDKGGDYYTKAVIFDTPRDAELAAAILNDLHAWEQ
jgi:hypothetical protein